VVAGSVGGTTQLPLAQAAAPVRIAISVSAARYIVFLIAHTTISV